MPPGQSVCTGCGLAIVAEPTGGWRSSHGVIESIRAHAAALGHAAKLAAIWHARRLHAIDSHSRQQLTSARSHYEQAMASIRQAHEQSLRHSQQILRDVRQETALEVLPWDDPAWNSYAAMDRLPRVVRFGMLRETCHSWRIEMPALHPFAPGGNFLIKTSGQAREAAAQALQAFVLRMLCSLPPPRCACC
jgi:hypothetical protein